LKQVGQWLAQSAGDSGLLARLNDDRFAMIIPEVRRESDLARFLGNTIGELQAQAFRLSDAEFRISAKFGVALFPNDGESALALYQNAESALKNAKVRGERCVFYTSEMSQMIADKLMLENQLRQALDNREFELYYQPKVERDSGKLVGAEALLRWNRPQVGLTMPGEFIPVLEETGMIKQVGRWVLHQALDDYLRWKRDGLEAVRIAVNVSPLQLHDLQFADELRAAFGASPERASGIELEITESVIMQNIEQCTANLRAIRAMGVTIAIDDFGTGFSSLAYLTRLPLDTLKIDCLFVANMAESAEGRTLVSTIIAMANSLKLNVVAEGVETLEQVGLLSSMGCDVMQGYLFGEPMPRNRFEAEFLRPST
jgi:EAL domain-containing protein (putative c-di-GMP-specific phosphodiesterase class I)